MTEPPVAQPTTDAELNAIKAQAERDKAQAEKDKAQTEKDKAQTERDKLALERTFAKKWAAPILGLAGVIVAGFFSVAAVLVTSILKNAEDRRSMRRELPQQPRKPKVAKTD